MIFFGVARLADPNQYQEQATELAEISGSSGNLGDMTGKNLVLAAGVVGQVLEPGAPTRRNYR
jgi:hypothetical protein